MSITMVPTQVTGGIVIQLEVMVIVLMKYSSWVVIRLL